MQSSRRLTNVGGTLLSSRQRLQCFLHHIENICRSPPLAKKIKHLVWKVTKGVNFDASRTRGYTCRNILGKP
jgi:hypothetical protein